MRNTNRRAFDHGQTTLAVTLDDRRKEKWPRHYAAEIMALPTRAERVDALARVPEAWRSWVEYLVLDWFARSRAKQVYRKGA